MFKVVLAVLFFLIGAAIHSAANGFMPSHADGVFLALLAWTVVATIVRGKIINKIDKTNGNDTSIIAFFFYLIVAVLSVLAACLAALGGVNAFTAFVLGAVLITVTAGATAWMHT